MDSNFQLQNQIDTLIHDPKFTNDLATEIKQLKAVTNTCNQLSNDLSDKLLEVTDTNKLDLNYQINQFSENNSQLREATSHCDQLSSDLSQQIRDTTETSNQLKDHITGLQVEQTSLSNACGELRKIISSFSRSVAEIEERLFKTYCEYKTENRTLYQNNLLQLFLIFDLDRDGLLDENEFAKFAKYYQSLYRQTLVYPYASTTNNLGIAGADDKQKISFNDLINLLSEMGNGNLEKIRA